MASVLTKMGQFVSNLSGPYMAIGFFWMKIVILVNIRFTYQFCVYNYLTIQLDNHWRSRTGPLC